MWQQQGRTREGFSNIPPTSSTNMTSKTISGVQTQADPKGGQGMPWHTLSGPPRPTQEHAISLLLPSPSKRRHADTAEKKERRGLRLPHAITRRLRDRPSAHGSPLLGVAQQHSRAGRRRAGHRLAVLVASHPRGPKTPTRSVRSAVSCELLASHRRRPVPAGDHPRGQKVDY